MLGDAIAAALPELRAEAAGMMTDTFHLLALTETTDADGMSVHAWAPTGDPIPGRFPSRRSGGDAQNMRMVDVGGVERPIIEGGLHLPFSASPEPGQRYRCTAIGPRTHPSALGRTVQVIEAPVASNMTAWRLNVVEV